MSREVIVRGENWRSDFNRNSPLRRKVDALLQGIHDSQKATGLDKYGPDFVGDPLLHAIGEIVGLELYLGTQAVLRDERPAPAPATGRSEQELRMHLRRIAREAQAEWGVDAPDYLDPELDHILVAIAAALASPAGAGTPEPPVRFWATFEGEPLYVLNYTEGRTRESQEHRLERMKDMLNSSGAVPQAGAHAERVRVICEKHLYDYHPLRDDCVNPAYMQNGQVAPAPAPTVTPAATELVKRICHAVSGTCVSVLQPGRPHCTAENCSAVAAAEAWAAAQEGGAG